GQCSISRLSAQTFEIHQTIDLSLQAQEIYDLLPVEGSDSWRTVEDIEWRDTTIRELATLLDQRTSWAKHATAVVEQRDRTITTCGHDWTTRTHSGERSLISGSFWADRPQNWMRCDASRRREIELSESSSLGSSDSSRTFTTTCRSRSSSCESRWR